MNRIEKLLDSFGFIRKEKAVAPSVSASNSSLNIFTLWRSQQKVSAAKAMEAYTGWVYASIRAIMMDVAVIPFQLFKVGPEEDKELFEHELLDVLGAVNDYQTGFQLKCQIAAHLELTGNAYIYLEGATNENSKPTALHVMNPAFVQIVADRDAFPPRIQGYKYTLGTKIYTFQPHEVVHIKNLDPNDAYEGIGTVQAIASWIDADNAAMDFNRMFFKNGTRIGGYLESEAALTPEQLEYLKISFEAAHKGMENAYKVMALPKGTKFNEGGSSQKDMDFSGLIDRMGNRIIAGFRTPRTALGITDDVNRANAEATDYVFAARVIKPLMTLITDHLNEFLVPRYGEDLYLTFKDPVPEDRAQRMDEMNKAVGGNPIMTTNEARSEYLGLDPVPGGDDIQVPFNFLPMGSNGADFDEGNDDEKAQGKPRLKALKPGEKKVVRTRYAMNMKRRKDLNKTIADNAAKEIAQIFKEAAEMSKKVRKDIAQLSDEDFEKIYKGFALRVTPYEKKLKASVRELNEKQKKEVRANLSDAIKAIDKKDLFNRKENIAVLVSLVRPLVYDLTGKEGAAAAALLGIENMDVLTPEVRVALDRTIELLSRSYNDTTLDLLKGKLEQGLKEGLSQGELAKLVDDVYEYSDEVRATHVAATETFRIANYATQEAWKQSGIVQSQRWYTAADERVCPYCGPQHGKVISIDQEFFKKGDEVTGSDGSKISIDYSDVGAPPLHVSCRCYIRPEEISLE